jgi:hypothetical protein
MSDRKENPVLSPKWVLDTKTDCRLTVDRNITLTLTLIQSEENSEGSSVVELSCMFSCGVLTSGQRKLKWPIRKSEPSRSQQKKDKKEDTRSPVRMERVFGSHWLWAVLIVREGVSKSNHPIQNPLLSVTEPRTRDSIFTSRTTEATGKTGMVHDRQRRTAVCRCVLNRTPCITCWRIPRSC